MKNILIVEDETAAKENLIAMLNEFFGREINVVGTTETIRETVDWIKTNPEVDLIFMDINLADGNAFNIFEQVEVQTPIIFTTAYDEYALKAFTVNSIDYILKPIHEEDLKRAIAKWQSFSSVDKASYVSKVASVASSEISQQRNFLIQIKDKIITLKTEDIAFFYTSNEKVSVYTFDDQVFQLNYTLEFLFKKLDQQEFYRANRQFIIARGSIKEIVVWFGSRLKVKTLLVEPESIIISKVRVPEFKKWLSI